MFKKLAYDAVYIHIHACVRTYLCMYLGLKCKKTFLNICNTYFTVLFVIFVYEGSNSFFFFIVNVLCVCLFHWGWSGDFSSLYSKKNLLIYCLLTFFFDLNKRVIFCNQNNLHDYFLLHCYWFGVLKSVLLFDSFFLFYSFISCKFLFLLWWLNLMSIDLLLLYILVSNVAVGIGCVSIIEILWKD